MKLIPFVTITVAAASTATAQFAAPNFNGGPPPGGPGDFNLGPHGGPDGWMSPPGAPSPVMPPTGDTSCWYLRQPAGEWVNICEKTSAAPQTVPQTYSTPTPTTYRKTHPHQWHRRPRPYRPTHQPEVAPWW